MSCLEGEAPQRRECARGGRRGGRAGAAPCTREAAHISPYLPISRHISRLVREEAGCGGEEGLAREEREGLTDEHGNSTSGAPSAGVSGGERKPSRSRRRAPPSGRPSARRGGGAVRLLRSAAPVAEGGGAGEGGRGVCADCGGGVEPLEAVRRSARPVGEGGQSGGGRRATRGCWLGEGRRGGGGGAGEAAGHVDLGGEEGEVGAAGKRPEPKGNCAVWAEGGVAHLCACKGRGCGVRVRGGGGCSWCGACTAAPAAPTSAASMRISACGEGRAGREGKR